MPGHWQGLHNRQFLIFFQKFGQILYSSEPAQLKWLASYTYKKKNNEKAKIQELYARMTKHMFRMSLSHHFL